MTPQKITLGRWTEEGIESLLQVSSTIPDAGERIEFISRRFVGTPYGTNTLIGDEKKPEVLVIDLERVDCFTFLDYVEAMRLSGSFDEFREKVKRVRYQSGKVAYEKRNHFFTDWRELNSDFVEDITVRTGGEKTRRVRKMLNMRDDGTPFLPGIQSREREIGYIPSESLDRTVAANLRTGDYAGIYSERAGLDVSHAGIVIKDGEGLHFRHASSAERHMKVVDEDLRAYLAAKPGLVLLRSKTPVR